MAMQIEVVAKAKAEAKKKAKADDAAEKKADADDAAKLLPATIGRGLTDGDVAAIAVVGGGDRVGHPKAETRTTFQAGDAWLVPGTKRGAPKLSTVVLSVLKNRCWVKIGDKGERMKLLQASMEFAEQPAAVPAAAAAVVVVEGSGGDSNSGDVNDGANPATRAEAVAGSGGDVDGAGVEGLAADAWQSAADVFGNFSV